MAQRTRMMKDSHRGFILVEMAFVLIMVRIIIGAAVKGKDLVRGVGQKRIYSKFLRDWRISFLNIYDRSGKRSGDFINNSAPFTPAAGQDGLYDIGTADWRSPAAAVTAGRHVQF